MKTKLIVHLLCFVALFIFEPTILIAQKSLYLYYANRINEYRQDPISQWDINRVNPFSLKIERLTQISTPKNKFIARFTKDYSRIAYLAMDGNYYSYHFVHDSLRNIKPTKQVVKKDSTIETSGVIEVIDINDSLELNKTIITLEKDGQVQDLFWVNQDSLVIHLIQSRVSKVNSRSIIEGFQKFDYKSIIMLYTVKNNYSEVVFETEFMETDRPLRLKPYAVNNSIYIGDGILVFILDLISGERTVLNENGNHLKGFYNAPGIKWYGVDQYSPSYTYSLFRDDMKTAGIVNLSSGKKLVIAEYSQIPSYMSMNILGWSKNEEKVYFQFVPNTYREITPYILSISLMGRIYSLDIKNGATNILFELNYDNLINDQSVVMVTNDHIVLRRKRESQPGMQYILVDLHTGRETNLIDIKFLGDVKWIIPQYWRGCRQ